MRFVAVFLLLGLVAAAQQTRTVHPNSFSKESIKVAHEPPAHLDISNSVVRAFRIELAPHATATIHTAHDYVLLAITGGQAEIGVAASSMPLNLQSGEAEVFKGGWPQQLHSTSDTASTWVVVEPMHGLRPERATCGLNGADCGSVRFGKGDDGEYDESTLFETPALRLSRAELGPHSALSTHTDLRDHVVVPLANETFELNGQSVSDTAPRWVHGSADLHSGADKAKFLIVEFK